MPRFWVLLVSAILALGIVASSIFLVLQHRQAERTRDGDFRFKRDLGALLDAPSDDVFMLKVNYWLGL